MKQKSFNYHDQEESKQNKLPSKFKIGIEQGVDINDTEESMEMTGCLIKKIT